jgi:hypothetical protein
MPHPDATEDTHPVLPAFLLVLRAQRTPYLVKTIFKSAALALLVTDLLADLPHALLHCIQVPQQRLSARRR